MIIYNTTVSIEENITRDWLNWMKSEHIPEVMACGLFIRAQINRIISEEDSHNTFSIAYVCMSMKELRQYQIEFSTELQAKHTARYGDKVVAFRTILEVIEEF